ncbi:MFS transporter [Amycolatopsis deserti]|uniref:MFS transporter n=1 Tax=Amycolatopsis deserti TaxID=185696 RepID=A0ABQ3IEY0_9PSEU|nr:MFS transporter [Amycolatopsis deserti]GHE80537.1 MFS transporter [Amycolatopsis deserti]
MSERSEQVRNISSPPAVTPEPGVQRRALIAGMLGTGLELFDWVLYGTAAAVVFGTVFFPTVSPVAGTLAAFATFSAGFIARPLGGVVFAHVGDKFGRKRVLQTTVLMMGGGTVLIGLVPGYAQIGIAAPVLLVLLRLVQGVAAGGELGGAVAIVLEHTPEDRRATRGALLVGGGVLGAVLASAAFLTTSLVFTRETFLAWGWRMPFLLSVIVLVVGLYIRARMQESPAYTKMVHEKAVEKTPVLAVLRKHRVTVLLVIAVTAAQSGVASLLFTFTLGYLATFLKMSQAFSLGISVIVNVALFVSYVVGGRLADSFGRRRTMAAGFALCIAVAFPFFLLLDTRTVALILVAVTLLAAGAGLVGGPMVTHFAELFPPQVRVSGFSLGYQTAVILGGGLAPSIAGSLAVVGGGSSWGLGVYIAAASAIGLLALVFLRDAAGPRAAPAGFTLP